MLSVSALISLRVINLSLEMNSATSISYMTWKVLPFDVAVRLFWRFFTAHAQFWPYYYFRLKIWRHIWILRTPFLSLGPGTPATHFDGFIYIRYAAPSYSARISHSVHLFPFRKVWFGNLSSVCWPTCATSGSEAERRIYGGCSKTPVLFLPVCGPKFIKLQNNVEDLFSQCLCPIVYDTFRLVDIRY